MTLEEMVAQAEIHVRLVLIDQHADEVKPIAHLRVPNGIDITVGLFW